MTRRRRIFATMIAISGVAAIAAIVTSGVVVYRPTGGQSISVPSDPPKVQHDPIDIAVVPPANDTLGETEIPDFDTAPKGKFRVSRVIGPPQAAYLAWLDGRRAEDDPLRIAPGLLAVTRWIWVPSGQEADWKALVHALNLVSRNGFTQRALPIAGGKIVRITLTTLTFNEGDVIDWLSFWEQFQFDPKFNRIVTKGSLKFLTLLEKEKLPKIKSKIVQKRTVPKTDTTPERVDIQTVEQELAFVDAKDIDIIRVNQPNIPQMADLQKLTGSQAPIVSLQYFITRAATTLKFKNNVYNTVYGGLYYQLRGIKKANDDQKKLGATDEDVFFENIGIGNIKGGLKAKDLFAKLPSDQRVAVFKSAVTGKPRRVDMFNTPSNGGRSPWGAITHDLKDENADVDTHPIANQLEIEDDAREAIFPDAKGFPLFAMFNGKGELQEEVPFDVALDGTIPHPYSKRLNVIGCIRCHGDSGSGGWKDLRNDVKKMMTDRYGVDSFGDLSQLNIAIDETNKRLFGLYQGDFGKAIRRAREDYAEVVLRATGPWHEKGKLLPLQDIASTSSQRIGSIYNDYWYNTVTPKAALLELGYDVPEEWAQIALKLLLPPDVRARVGSIIPEDFRIGGLLANVDGGIGRSDWDFVYSFAAERAAANQKALGLE